ncbi:hypothetical protein ACFQ48_18065 [Hymenobacter caeli]|uniref:Uncharacterized protein n=1 Tax=Hymenobacter caeli TaxID=2735894 RepID=A0ABX2FWR5_9BACT|nr:hypothetical protein [Hymenobacter caeli]NRT20886.1 hypothetical protein [Hymenobacter caeli]
MRSFLRSLFSSAPTARSGEWRPFALTAAQAGRHQQWVEQRIYRNWLGPYFKAYHLHRAGAAGRRGLRAEPLREEGRQGAMLYYDDSINPVNFRHFYELVGERIVGLGYLRAAADECTRRHENLHEHTYKLHFKPPPVDCPDCGLCDQRYGLVTLDLVALNGQPLFIRLAANPVLEPGFTAAVSFEELLRTVFDEPFPTPEEEVNRLEYTQF